MGATETAMRPGCARKGEHPAYWSFQRDRSGNVEREKVYNSKQCDATRADWEMLYSEFQRGANSLYLCAKAARKMGLLW